MGAFTTSVEAVTVTTRCVVGREVEKFDNEDRASFVDLITRRRWSVIENASAGKLKYKTLRKHGAGTCICTGDVPGKGVSIGDG